jgi:hypothetical protein
MRRGAKSAASRDMSGTGWESRLPSGFRDSPSLGEGSWAGGSAWTRGSGIALNSWFPSRKACIVSWASTKMPAFMTCFRPSLPRDGSAAAGDPRRRQGSPSKGVMDHREKRRPLGRGQARDWLPGGNRRERQAAVGLGGKEGVVPGNQVWPYARKMANGGIRQANGDAPGDTRREKFRELLPRLWSTGQCHGECRSNLGVDHFGG